MWERSAATPGVLTTSYNANSVIRGEVLRSRDNGCLQNGQQLRQFEEMPAYPIPPDAPATTIKPLEGALSHPLNLKC